MRRRRILIADDNLDSAAVLGELLSGRGHEVQTAADGRAALLLTRTFAPEVVILDLDMPGLDGFQTARALRNLDDRLTLAALTGLPPALLPRELLDECFDWLFAKPVELGELDELLDEIDATPD